MASQAEQLANSNDAYLERLWATKAVAHAAAYERLIHTSKNLSKLRLTKIDDQIYEHFRREFPDLNVQVFDYDGSKTEENKEKWRKFIDTYTDETVRDFNMATLIRVDALKEFDSDNSCIVVRIQFHAIEIARNREGINARRQEIAAEENAPDTLTAQP